MDMIRTEPFPKDIGGKLSKEAFIVTRGNLKTQLELSLWTSVLDNKLYLSLNGYRKEKHRLHHHHGDTLSIEMTYLDCLKRVMWPKTYKGYYLLDFISDEDKDITGIIWRPDWAIPHGELFVK